MPIFHDQSIKEQGKNILVYEQSCPTRSIYKLIFKLFRAEGLFAFLQADVLPQALFVAFQVNGNLFDMIEIY